VIVGFFVVQIEKVHGGESARADIIGRQFGLRCFTLGVEAHDGKTLGTAHFVPLWAAMEDQDVSAAAASTARHGSHSLGRLGSIDVTIPQAQFREQQQIVAACG